MTGWLRVVGLGPGEGDADPGWTSLEATRILAEASDVVGYESYVARVPAREGLTRHASANGVEVERARAALDLAAAGRRVAVVSGGDAGVFGMASAVMEAIAAGPSPYRTLDVAVAPGISAVQAVAARLGAPLGGDFAVISLSDRLKDRAVVLARLEAALAADFVIALYNPAGRERRETLHDAAEAMRRVRPARTPLCIARKVGGPGERIAVLRLGDLDAAALHAIDMNTLLLLGSSETRLVERGAERPYVFTARSVGRLDPA
jgi:precorrin-3B C17-methyltransferase